MATEPPIPHATRTFEVARLAISHLGAETPLDEVFRKACELAAEALHIERVGVWLLIDEQKALRCTNLYERSKQEHSSGALLHVADFPKYFQSLQLRKAIPAEIAGTEPWTAELADAYLRPLGIGSMLDAGLFLNGELVGVVCHEQVGTPREWTTEARDFAGSVADLLALRMQSAEVRELRAAFLKQRERTAQQDKAASLEQLAAGVAHDFKNLLMVVVAYAEMLAERSDIPIDAQQQCKEIFLSAQRGITLAKDLLDFARPSDRPPRVLDLASVLNEFLPMLQATIGPTHQLAYSCPEQLPNIMMDKIQLMRLLMNLVVNASEAMPNGGPIAVRLQAVRLTGDPSYTGRYVLLEVADQGTGMDAQTQAHLFDPYYTTKADGNGLGLATVRQIVERVGGIIRVESVPQQGTTFRIFFPSIGATTGETRMFTIPPELRQKPSESA